jgi:geranylgeranyl diphosphate synthase, type II
MIVRHFQRRYDTLRHAVDRSLLTAVPHDGPAELTEACRHVLAGGGKRLRAILLILACQAVGGRGRSAVHAGCAVEIMHNFTLVHDDIMDHAPTRRGRPTVHVRWGLNTALLSGDVLLGLAYRQLLRTRSDRLPLLTALFTTAVLEVCEGQALDLEFERRTDVTVDEYFAMIEKKTGRLFSLSAELGGIIGAGSHTHVASLSRFGHYLGRAFQLQDDLLDVIADEKRFGKTIGGDIVEGKRTFLLLRAAERARGRDRTVIRTLLRRGAAALGPPREVVHRITEIYERSGILEETEKQIALNTRRAVASLEALPAGHATAMLRWLSEALVNRAS